MNYVFPPEPQVGVPVVGSDAQFPVRRIYCVGRNYAAHAREMGADERDPPFFFCKPDNTIVFCPPGSTVEVPYPAQTSDYQHEIELVAAIGKGGSNIPVARANEHVFGYAVGLDMTRRDLQSQMKKQGRPWEVGKAFDQSAPIGPIHPVAKIGHPAKGAIWIQVDGTDRQRSDISLLMWTCRDDRQPVDAVRAAARRSDLHRHARGRERGGAWADDDGRHRRPGRNLREGGVT